MPGVVDANARVPEMQIGPAQDASALVQEANELIAIVTTIIKKKRKNVAAKLAAKKAEPTGSAGEERRNVEENHEFQIPNS